LVAEVIQHFFPRLVELHNYTPANSSSQKKENWYMLNRKPLSKLNYQLSDRMIKELVTAQQGVIEKFLYTLKTKIDRALWNKEQRKKQNSLESHSSSSVFSAFHDLAVEGGSRYRTNKKDSGDVKLGRLVVDGQQVVPVVMYEEKEQEMIKEETVQLLTAKVRRLEHLLHLKDLRIEELNKRIDEMQPTGLEPQSQKTETKENGKRRKNNDNREKS
ncbi:sperm flagellar protein 1-like, partial [Limulus polyphemus]|uniref:Sperm flagellar protein 1-like n=1 Tax=Limulus polyphemus TaxID=6850 RepID=A0ABM1TIE3_LIMPO